MASTRQRFMAAIYAANLVFAAIAQAQLPVGQAPVAPNPATSVELKPKTDLQPLRNFRESEIRFSLPRLMALLRDRNHEDWILAAYPDPNTGYPLIGAGFSLDLAGTDHSQHDPLNPNPFLEPSSADLWQAAGLDPERLQHILMEFHKNMAVWGTEGYRRRIRTHRLPPQLTEADATRLLRISAIQAVLNARAYCRNFDRMSGPSQMALSQLAFQMGVNLEQFVEFLSEINGDTSHRDLSQPSTWTVSDAEHWRNVQMTLIDSQWARRYTVRAITVIAMFDPDYVKNPRAAEARVMFVLPSPVQQRHRRPARAHHRAK